jgi:hypothetical protein
MLSIGGWSGSAYFSSAVATDANRTAFANAIVNVVSQYQFDGIEFECALFSSSRVLSAHRPVVGNIPVNKEWVATSYLRTIARIFFCFCKRFVTSLRTSSCPPQCPSNPSSAPTVIPCPTSPNLRKSSTTSVRFFSCPVSHLFLTVSPTGRDHELRCLGKLGFKCWTQCAFERYMCATL